MMMHKKSKFAQLNSQAGFNLVELMITLVISLLIMLSLGTLFLNTTRSSSEMAKTNLQIENGRFAMQILGEDLIHAGYWGGHVPDFDNLTVMSDPADFATSVPQVCHAYSAWNDDYKTNLIAIPVQSYDAVPTGCNAVVSSKKANTDVLVVRHASTCVAGVGECEADTAGKLYLQVSDCSDTSVDAHPYLLKNSGFDTLHKLNCTTAVTEKRKFISNIYYIRDFATTAGDGIPTLVRSSFDFGGGLAHQPAEPLIEGIEGFHVELGIDGKSDAGFNVELDKAVEWADDKNLTSPTNRGDGMPDGSYVECTAASPCDEDQLMNVVAVKLYVLARNLETTPGYTDDKTYNLGSVTLGPFNDNYKRHVFSKTVRLINISARRETP